MRFIPQLVTHAIWGMCQQSAGCAPPGEAQRAHLGGLQDLLVDLLVEVVDVAIGALLQAA